MFILLIFYGSLLLNKNKFKAAQVFVCHLFLSTKITFFFDGNNKKHIKVYKFAIYLDF